MAELPDEARPRPRQSEQALHGAASGAYPNARGGPEVPDALSVVRQKPGAEQPPGLWDGVPWYRSWWVRGPVLALALIDGGINADTALNGHENSLAERAALGAVGVAFGLLFWGGAWWLLGHLFKKRWRYGRVVTSFPLILLIWLGTVGNLARSGNSLTEKTSDSSAVVSRTSSAEPKPGSEQAAFTDWYISLTDTYASRRRAIKAYDAWSKSGDPAGPRALSRLRRAVRYAKVHEQQAFALAATSTTGRPTELMQKEAQDLRRCLEQTQTLFKEPASLTRSAARAADRLCNRSERRVKVAAREGDRIYQELGGADAMPQVYQRAADLVRQGRK